MKASKRASEQERKKGGPTRSLAISHTRPLALSVRGQSMLEAIIAAGIIVTAVTSALTLVSAAVSAEKESESSIIAAGLAREGIEVVRAIRDGNWLSGADWNQGLEGPANDYTGVPVFAPVQNSWSVLFSPSSIADPQAAVYRYVASATPEQTIGLFVQASSSPTGTVQTLYRRFLTLNPICSDAPDTPRTSGPCPVKKIGIQVLSEVRWRIGDRPRTLLMEERIFDWK